MNVVITITLPATAQGFTAVADLVRRFGDEACVVRVEDDEVDEDEVDEDMLLTILHGASQRLGDRPEARQLGELIHALQAPPAQRREQLQHPREFRSPSAVEDERDQAPAHGIPRPGLFVKPNATQKRVGNTPGRKAALDYLVENSPCPHCGAARGKFCRSTRAGRPAGETYGYQHVHQARIDRFTWAEGVT